MQVGIQYLRVIAALLVVVFHIQFFSPLPWALETAKAGVDIFFVISGVVIALSSSDQTPGRFLLRRVWRVVPIYWLVTLVYGVFYLVQGHGVSAQALGQSLLFWPFANPLHGDRIVPVVGVGWTLNLEMMFYLLFAAVLWLPVAWRSLALVVCFAGLIGLGQVAQTVPGQFFGQMIILEFLAGYGLARLMQSGRLGPVWLGVVTVSLGAAGLATGWPATSERLIDLGLPAVAIVHGVMCLEPVIRRRPMPSLLLLGQASFALYLGHKLVIEVAHLLAYRGLFPSQVWLVWPILIAVSLGLAIASYLLIEKPLMRLPARLSLRRTKSVSA